jgi:hypothetical protein
VMAVFAYAPPGPQRYRTQALGVAAIAIIVAGVGFAGVHRVNHDCSIATTTSGSISQEQTSEFCQVFDPSLGT